MWCSVVWCALVWCGVAIETNGVAWCCVVWCAVLCCAVPEHTEVFEVFEVCVCVWLLRCLSLFVLCVQGC